jgi:hypothetical protein
MECVLCTMLSCMPGFYSSGCGAGSTRDASCVPCMGGAAVGPFDWVRGCEYVCSEGFYRVNGTMCMPCSRPVCSAGFYASECLDSADVVCLPFATLSSVAVPVVVTPPPVLAIYDEGGMQWVVPGVVVCVLLLVLVGLGVVVGVQLRKECGLQYAPVAVVERVVVEPYERSGVEFPLIDTSMRRRSRSRDRMKLGML